MELEGAEATVAEGCCGGGCVLVRAVCRVVGRDARTVYGEVGVHCGACSCAGGREGCCCCGCGCHDVVGVWL